MTGGIGSGKTAVSDRFSSLGIKIVDADIASRAVVEPGQPALKAIADYFGSALIQTDGTLNRRLLREQIFGDSTKRRWLEKLLHPLIGAYTNAELKSAESPYVMLVSPLLIEAGNTRFTNRILVVDVPEQLQIERVMKRDSNTANQVSAIIEVQTSREKRLKQADDVILNDGSLTALDEIVETLHAQYENLAAEYNKTQSQ
ncbi:MAG: dephospho-CoA kinase [Pseudomonadales bacterium]|nr:dephospho-CoA kinase [Pseudomonadales bacterium]